MSDVADDDGWSAVAEGWSELWAASMTPAYLAVLDAAGVGPGTRVLDLGCGAGELLELAASRGADVAGADPAPGMLRVAALRLPAAELRVAGFERVPWPDASIDVVTAVNALQFADDVDDALAEVMRVLRPGGTVGLASWAENARNDVDVLERGIADALGDEAPPDAEYRHQGGLASILEDAGFTDVVEGIVAVPLVFADDDALVRGALLGEDAATLAERAPIVTAAAASFRRPDGSYRLENAFRWAVGRTPR